MFADAPATEWTRARGIIASQAVKAGIDHARAEDMAQHAMLSILKRTKPYRKQVDGPAHAAWGMVGLAKRRGWIVLDPDANRANYRQTKGVQADADAHVVNVAQGRSITPSPAAMAEDADRLGVPVDRIHAAHGIGPGALSEPGHTPSVYGSGPATPTPVTGCRFARLATDPNMDATLAARTGPVWREGEDLTHYRAQLAEYYAGR
jgi:hypothetical protein